MLNEPSTIVQRLWGYCNVLRDDGVSYGDYVEQLTYLLFLKMADEQTSPLSICLTIRKALTKWHGIKHKYSLNSLTGSYVPVSLIDNPFLDQAGDLVLR